jgi:ABC-type transport system involved in cytochrome c biogenesis permease subunit
MINAPWILAFIALYSLSLTGDRKGRNLFIAGLLLHVGYMVYRGLYLGWVPVTERHDILLIMGLIVAGGFFYLNKRIPLNMLLDTLPLFVILLCFFAVFQIRMDSIEPYMESKWFYMHIVFLIIGYAFFILSSVAGISYLRGKALTHETLQYRLALFGWLFFSFSLIGGSFWFYYTYGSYWLWTAKELWITIVWFYYGFYLHGRQVKALSGRVSVVLGVAGFPVLIFAYLGVMPIIGSPWTQF